MTEGAGYTVLLYHGVHGDGLPGGPENSSGKHVSRRRFAAQMNHLRESFPLVTMREIAAAHRGKASLPDGAVAVTFDDGLLNNFTEAWPVLEDCRVPATIYLATGYIGTGRMIWSDRLEAAVLGTAQESLTIREPEREARFPLSTADQRRRAYLEVKSFCKSLETTRKDEIVDGVCERLGASASADHPLYAFMDWDAVREMNRSALIDFGAHTVDHVSLAKCTRQAMLGQIDRSLDRVSRELDEECALFSYPEGQPDDYDEGVIAALRGRGLDHAPTAIDGANRVGETDPFHIRRCMVGFEGRPYPFADL